MTEQTQKNLDSFASAIIKSRALVEERLIAIALLAGAESLALEWPSTLPIPKWKRILKLDGRRKQARAMSLALTTARAWRDELESHD